MVVATGVSVVVGACALAPNIPPIESTIALANGAIIFIRFMCLPPLRFFALSQWLTPAILCLSCGRSMTMAHGCQDQRRAAVRALWKKTRGRLPAHRTRVPE
jgi:hypothetical protein